MRVFIPWSKEPSRSIAGALGTWLGGLVQVAEPWVSDEEIASGSVGDTEARVALHTRASLVPLIVERTNAEHPYDVPCVIALAIPDGEYLKWIARSASDARS